jgi:hypothetical protein
VQPPVGDAQQQAQRPRRRPLRLPRVAARSRRQLGRGQYQAGVHHVPRAGVRVGDQHRRAHLGDAEQEPRELERQVDAAVAARGARHPARVQRHPVPGQPLGVRHRRLVVGARTVHPRLLQDREYAGRGDMPRPAGARRADPDLDPVAVDPRELLREADQHHHRPARRQLGLPSEPAGLQGAVGRQDRGLRQHDRRQGQQGGGTHQGRAARRQRHRPTPATCSWSSPSCRTPPRSGPAPARRRSCPSARRTARGSRRPPSAG